MDEDLRLRDWFANPDEDEVLTAAGSSVPEPVAQAVRFFCRQSLSDDDWKYAREKVMESTKLDWFVRELGELVRAGRVSGDQWFRYTDLTPYEPDATDQQQRLVAALERAQEERRQRGSSEPGCQA